LAKFSTESAASIAALLHVSKSLIHLIRRGKKWKYLQP
jgi:hypothetical protein